MLLFSTHNITESEEHETIKESLKRVERQVTVERHEHNLTDFTNDDISLNTTTQSIQHDLDTSVVNVSDIQGRNTSTLSDIEFSDGLNTQLPTSLDGVTISTTQNDESNSITESTTNINNTTDHNLSTVKTTEPPPKMEDNEIFPPEFNINDHATDIHTQVTSKSDTSVTNLSTPEIMSSTEKSSLENKNATKKPFFVDVSEIFICKR